jgi:small subunit ribosomal protein S2
MVDVVEQIEGEIKDVGEAIEEIAEKVVEKIKEKKKKSDNKSKKDAEQQVIRDDKKTVKTKSKKSSINESKQLSDSEQISEKNFEKKAEAESSATEVKEKSLDERKKALLEKAAKLKEKVSADVTTEELKEQVKAKKKTDMLIPLDEYVKAGIYLGTRVVTPDMKPFVYRRRADGLAIFNTDTIDEKLKEGIEYLSKFNPEDIILICKRQAGWKTAEMFSKLTGIRVFTKKYPAGILTNTNLPNFFENELTIITDHWLDKNALNDTLKVRKKVLMVCDTNNFAKGASQIIIGNNKSARSLGIIFYLLARGYCKNRKLETADEIPDLDWWTSSEEA